MSVNQTSPPITALIMCNDGGEKPVYCLMAAYASEQDAINALRLITTFTEHAGVAAAPSAAAAQQQAVSEATPGDSIKKYRLTWQEAEAICVRDEVDEALREFVHDSTGDNAIGLARCIVESWLRHPSLATPAPTQQAVLVDVPSAAAGAAQAVAYLMTRPSGFAWPLMPKDVTPEWRAFCEAEGTRIEALTLAAPASTQPRS